VIEEESKLPLCFNVASVALKNNIGTEKSSSTCHKTFTVNISSQAHLAAGPSSVPRL
jgi:hypothetical protein